MKACALVFPGQGSQHPGMGRELAATLPECREAFEAADAALGWSLSTMCFDGSTEDLALTENTQPAILTVSVAAWRALERRGVRPLAAAGHSLGEYTAHVAAGTLDFTDAVRVVRSRGRFMQEAVPLGEGAMAAILGLEQERVERLCREAAEGRVVGPANLNGPGQIVVAGHAEAVERAMELARSAGASRVVRLPVSAPFHCRLMEPAARRLEAVLREVPLQDPAMPVYSNVDAARVTTSESALDALVRQVASPVRWEALVEAMIESGIETFVEVGPGRVLGGLIRRIHKGTRVLNVSDLESLAKSAAELGE